MRPAARRAQGPAGRPRNAQPQAGGGSPAWWSWLPRTNVRRQRRTVGRAPMPPRPAQRGFGMPLLARVQQVAQKTRCAAHRCWPLRGVQARPARGLPWCRWARARPGAGRTGPCRCVHRLPASVRCSGQVGRALAAATADSSPPAIEFHPRDQDRLQQDRRCSAGSRCSVVQALEARSRVALQPADQQARSWPRPALARPPWAWATRLPRPRRAGSGAVVIPRGRRTGSCGRSDVRVQTPARHPPSHGSCPGSSRRTAAARTQIFCACAEGIGLTVGDLVDEREDAGLR
jgi:hypothetical protein